MSSHRLQRSFPTQFVGSNVQISLKGLDLKIEGKSSRTPSPHFKLSTDRSNKRSDADKIYNSAVIQAMILANKNNRINTHKRVKTTGEKAKSPDRKNENGIRRSTPHNF